MVERSFLAAGGRMTLLVTKNYKFAYSYLVKHLIFIMVLETRCSVHLLVGERLLILLLPLITGD